MLRSKAAAVIVIALLITAAALSAAFAGSDEAAPGSAPETTAQVAPVKMGIPAAGQIDNGRITYIHDLIVSERLDGTVVRRLLTTLTVTGSTNSRHFPTGVLSFSCSHPSEQMGVSVSAQASRAGASYSAWLDTDADIAVAFEDNRIRSDIDFDAGIVSGTLTGDAGFAETMRGYGSETWADWIEAQTFFQEAERHSRLTVRLPELDGTILLRFDLGGVFGTPVQHIIERCLADESALGE